MVSIVIPTHKFPNSEFYLNRLLESIRNQSYQDYEIIVVRQGKSAAEKLNKGFKEAQGDLIKVMFTDDYFPDEHALQRIVDAHKGMWSVCACIHDNGELFNPHIPKWNKDIILGNNTLGSPSVLTLTNTGFLPEWDENLHWLMDCVYYQKLFEDYGEPQILSHGITADVDIVIGIHENQQTNVLTGKEKAREYEYVKNKFT